MGGIASGIGGVLGGLFGGDQQANADNSEAAYLGNQAQGTYGSINSSYGNIYKPVNTATGSGYLGLANSANASLPSSFSALEGYASNPNGTNLASTGATTLGQELGQAKTGYGTAYNNFEGNQLANGLSQQSIGADMNTVKAANTQAMNNERNQLGAASPNVAGMTGDALNSSLQNIAGAGANILGQNQAAQNAGAAGVAQGQQFQQQSGEAANSTASQMDAQQLAMLEQAFNLPMGSLTSAAGYGNSGTELAETGAQGLGQAAGGYSKQAAATPTIFSGLGQIASGLTGNPFSGLFGGGSNTSTAQTPNYGPGGFSGYLQNLVNTGAGS